MRLLCPYKEVNARDPKINKFVGEIMSKKKKIYVETEKKHNLIINFLLRFDVLM